VRFVEAIEIAADATMPEAVDNASTLPASNVEKINAIAGIRWRNVDLEIFASDLRINGSLRGGVAAGRRLNGLRRRTDVEPQSHMMPEISSGASQLKPLPHASWLPGPE
tara:strand:- start:135 stop:461 length:327 start_codon:yes stop_codon:yes gene_type:complete